MALRRPPLTNTRFPRINGSVAEELYRPIQTWELDNAWRAFTRPDPDNNGVVLDSSLLPGQSAPPPGLADGELISNDLMDVVTDLMNNRQVQDAVLGTDIVHNMFAALAHDVGTGFAEARPPPPRPPTSRNRFAHLDSLSVFPGAHYGPPPPPDAAAEHHHQQHGLFLEPLLQLRGYAGPGSDWSGPLGGTYRDSSRAQAAQRGTQAYAAQRQRPAAMAAAAGAEAAAARSAATAAAAANEEAFKRELEDYTCALCLDATVGAHLCTCRCNKIFCGKCILEYLSRHAVRRVLPDGRMGLACPTCSQRVDSVSAFPLMDATVERFVRGAPACASRDDWYARDAAWQRLHATGWPDKAREAVELRAVPTDPPDLSGGGGGSTGGDSSTAHHHVDGSDAPFAARADPFGDNPSRASAASAAAAAAALSAGDSPPRAAAAAAAAAAPEYGTAAWWAALPEPVRAHGLKIFSLCALATVFVFISRHKQAR